MPIATVQILEGRTEDQHRALISAVTQAIVQSLAVKLGSGRVIVQQVPAGLRGLGGIPIKNRKP